MQFIRPEKIALITDFGNTGFYTGQMLSVLGDCGVPVIPMMSDAPVFDPRCSSILLSALARMEKQPLLFVCVVDPGVGSSRQPLLLRTDKHWFVGPDNGIFSGVLHDHPESTVEILLWEPDDLSATFHGRDLFAPVACRLINQESVKTRPIDAASCVGNDWPVSVSAVIYIDHFGNLITGIKAENISRKSVFSLSGEVIAFARTFSDEAEGALFWHENSIGLVEFSCREASAATRLKMRIGDPVMLLS